MAALSGCICGSSPKPPHAHPVVTGSLAESLIYTYERGESTYQITTVTPPVTEQHLGRAAVRVAAQVAVRQTAAQLECALVALNAASESMEPSLSGRRWRSMDVCPLGVLRLGDRIAATISANIYEADLVDAKTNEPVRHVIVKHMNDCRNRQDRGWRGRHPLVTDATFLSALASTGVVPELIYLSAGTVIPEYGVLPKWVRTKVITRQRGKCVRLGTETRFFVQEKVGVELGVYLRHINQTSSWPVMARRAVTLAIRVIQMLQTIHELGVVHGDIHGGNILFRKPSDGPENVAMNDTDLVFIDFEFAVFFPEEIGTGVTRYRLNRLSRKLLSHWHLDGFRIGRRDDVFRALEWLANVLSQGVYYTMIKERVRERIARKGALSDHFVAKLKEPRCMYFDDFPGSHDAELDDGIRIQLDHIAEDHLHALTHPDDRPEYDNIISHLKDVEAMLSSHC